MARPDRRDRVFISYRRSDSAGHAGRLNDDLTRLLGDRVFMDVADIAPGQDFERVLRTELATCGAVLAVIGARWREALAAPREGLDYVRLELAQALADPGVTVVPVLVQGAALPDAASLPDELKPLAARQALAVRDDRWKDDVANLARALLAAPGMRRWPVRAVAAGMLAVAALALWWLVGRPPAPTAFSRAGAHEITLAATRKVAVACKPAATLADSCPLVFEFVPDGAARKVYFASGSCPMKAPPFGDCVLERLEKLRIPPFDNLDTAEVGLLLRVQPGRPIAVTVDE